MQSRSIFATMAVEMLEDDNGVSETVYNGLVGLMRSNSFTRAANFVIMNTDATDGRFYLQYGAHDKLWNEFAEDMKRFTYND